MVGKYPAEEPPGQQGVWRLFSVGHWGCRQEGVWLFT